MLRLRKLVASLCVLGVVGCGRTNILGPDNYSVVAVNYAKASNLQVSTLERATDYQHGQGGLRDKNILLNVSRKTSSLRGHAQIGGAEAYVYIGDGEPLYESVATLFHELDHLRGLDHPQMPSLDEYRVQARKFLGQ